MFARWIALFMVAGGVLTAAQSLTIVNSGSTNQHGFRIVVERSGKATYTPAKRGKAQKKNVDKALAQRLFKDVDAVKPLGSLHAPGCWKSSSFGSTLVVEVGSERSPDLSCGDGGDANLAAVIKDVDAVVSVFERQPPVNADTRR